LAADTYAPASGRWITKIVSELGGRVPVIVFGKGVNGSWEVLSKTGADVLSVDWTVRLSDVRAAIPETIGLQGNLDPFILTTTPEIVAVEARRILQEMRGHNGFIFNLGHGTPPNAKLENIESLVATVHNFR
jgi:uroporphyrinogen decarboxylase